MRRPLPLFSPSLFLSLVLPVCSIFLRVRAVISFGFYISNGAKHKLKVEKTNFSFNGLPFLLYYFFGNRGDKRKGEDIESSSLSVLFSYVSRTSRSYWQIVLICNLRRNRYEGIYYSFRDYMK